MKKRILSILLALCMVLCLAPTAAFADGENTQNEKTYRICMSCGTYRTQEIIGYTANAGWGTSDTVHFIIVKCLTCNEKNTFVDGDPKYMFHTGGTETPTCTTGKTCEKCGIEYGKLGHDWGEWQSNGDNKTHTRVCKREDCNAVDTASCGGGTATCVTPGTCADCGQQYYSGHTFPSEWNWASDTNIGRDAEKHWIRCLNCEEGKAHEDTHYFVPFNIYLKSAATCISNAVYYTACWTCSYKGTDTFVDQWGQLDPDNHDGGTEVKNAKTATCTEKGYTGDTHCKGCGVKLSGGTDITALDHDWDKWTVNDDGTHTRVCKRDATHKETENCSGGTATCTEQATCEVCGEGYGSLKAHSFTAENTDAAYLKSAATCWEQAVYYKSCAACGLSSKGTADEATFQSGSMPDHNFGSWVSNGNDTHTHKCLTEGCTKSDTIPCSGGTATCTEQATCEVCGVKYGSTNAKNHPSLMHVEAKAATKWRDGNIEYWHCSDCGKFYKDAAATQEITEEQTVTNRLPFDYDPVDNPKTGAAADPDAAGNSTMALWIALLFIGGGAVTAATVVGRKRKHSR